MKNTITDELLNEIINEYARDILMSDSFVSEKKYIQHGYFSVYDHSVKVCKLCLRIAFKTKASVDIESLIRGSLLHDYFLYDWHEKDESHKWHGFHHAKKALQNAERDFKLNDIERNMIKSHMFPLNLVLPRYKESLILTIADKISTVDEVFLNIRKKKANA